MDTKFQKFNKTHITAHKEGNPANPNSCIDDGKTVRNRDGYLLELRLRFQFAVPSSNLDFGSSDLGSHL